MPVSIYGLPRGGGKITDATATPEKVFSGEVFYNNEGRQIGTYSSTIEVKSIYIPPHSMQYLDSFNSDDWPNLESIEVTLSANAAPDIRYDSYGVYNYYYDPINLPYNIAIVGVKKDGGTFYSFGWSLAVEDVVVEIDGGNMTIFPQRIYEWGYSVNPQIRFRNDTSSAYEIFYVESGQ